MKNRLTLVLMLLLFFIFSCKPTYTFIANNCPLLLTRELNTKVNISKLNKYNNNCERDGWGIVNMLDTTYMDTLIMLAKYKDGKINGRVYIIDEFFQIIQKYKVKNGNKKGICVTYYPAYQNLWLSITYTNRKNKTHILRSRSIKGLYIKAKRNCNYIEDVQ